HVQTNLFKCFVAKSWDVGAATGIVGFVHPEGIYDEPSGGTLRKAVYSRLRWHCQFSNELLLFSDIHDQKTFSVNVCCTTAQPRSTFNHVSNVFHPSVIDACLIHDGEGIVPGIKDEAGNWSLRPHRHRVIAIDKDRLSTFAKLYDEPDTPGLSA